MGYLPNKQQVINAFNQKLINDINDDGRIYLTRTKVDVALVIRLQAGQFDAAKQTFNWPMM